MVLCFTSVDCHWNYGQVASSQVVETIVLCMLNATHLCFLLSAFHTPSTVAQQRSIIPVQTER